MPSVEVRSLRELLHRAIYLTSLLEARVLSHVARATIKRSAAARELVVVTHKLGGDLAVLALIRSWV